MWVVRTYIKRDEGEKWTMCSNSFRFVRRNFNPLFIGGFGCSWCSRDFRWACRGESACTWIQVNICGFLEYIMEVFLLLWDSILKLRFCRAGAVQNMLTKYFSALFLVTYVTNPPAARPVPIFLHILEIFFSKKTSSVCYWHCLYWVNPLVSPKGSTTYM